MDKIRLYKKLDIETPEEFRYYENLSALLEDEEHIEENLIKDLLREIDKSTLSEHMDSFYDSFLNNIPDSETDLYILVESIRKAMTGMIAEEMEPEDIDRLAAEIYKFRKWYAIEPNVFDRIKGEEVSVRDARYDIVAAGFLGEKADFDFRTALDYDLEGYDMIINDATLFGE